MAVGASSRQSASRGERQEYLKSTRKPVALLGNLPRSRRRLQLESLKTKTLSVDTMTRCRKWPRSRHSLPFSAISGHFVKKIYTSTGNSFVSITSPSRSQLTSRLMTEALVLRPAHSLAGFRSLCYKEISPEGADQDARRVGAGTSLSIVRGQVIRVYKQGLRSPRFSNQIRRVEALLLIDSQLPEHQTDV